MLLIDYRKHVTVEMTHDNITFKINVVEQFIIKFK